MYEKDRLKQVSPQRPCPVCGNGTSHCASGARLVLCRKCQGERPSFQYRGQSKKDAQWAIYLSPKADASPQPARPHGNGHPIDWPARAATCARSLTPEARRQLAEHLGLPEVALGEHDIGYRPQDRHGPCWTFPECDGAGKIIGINRRYADSSKKAMPHSRRGLFLLARWREWEGPVFCPEGASDTLALRAVGLSAIGRPSNTSGVEHLAALFRGLPRDRRIVIVGDNDRKEGGKWPGREGAMSTARQLSEQLGRPVSWVLPPEGYKDVRAWALAQHADPTCADEWAVMGEKLSDIWDDQYQTECNGANVSSHSNNDQAVPNGNDSSPKAPPKEGTIWRPVPISQLKRVALPDTWVWEGLLAPGKITLLSAESKAGKTTLLSLLYQRMASGGRLCGTDVYPGRAIVVSEEPKDIWIERREHLGLGDHLEVVSMPFATKPTQRDWETMIVEAVQALKEQPSALVVFDTLSHLWWLWDENDNAKEAAALMPLRQLSNAGAALALVHHFGAEGKGPRGGTELRAFPDLIVDLHLYKANDFVDRRRVLKVRGRLLEPNQLTIQLNGDGDDYLVAEGALATGPGNLWAVLSQLVPSQPPGLSATGFQRAWPTQPAPKPKRLNEVLAERSERAGWVRTGAGKKNDPYCYWRPAPAAN